MSEQPRVGDRVRVVLEGEVTDLDDHGMVAMVRADGEDRAHYVPRAAKLEVVEPADDPSDPWGTIRTEAPDGLLWVKCANGDWTCLSVCVDDEDDDYVSAFPITGVVPDTPAAEAQQAKEDDDPLTPEYRAHIGRGGNGHNVPVAGCEFCPPVKADPHEPQVVVRAQSSPSVFEPKVWHSTGEEPPRDGRCLEYIEISDNRLPYLKNFGDMWLWVETPDAPDPRPEIGQWPPRHPGRYREVEQ